MQDLKGEEKQEAQVIDNFTPSPETNYRCSKSDATTLRRRKQGKQSDILDF